MNRALICAWNIKLQLRNLHVTFADAKRKAAGRPTLLARVVGGGGGGRIAKSRPRLRPFVTPQKKRNTKTFATIHWGKERKHTVERCGDYRMPNSKS